VAQLPQENSTTIFLETIKSFDDQFFKNWFLENSNGFVWRHIITPLGIMKQGIHSE